MPVPVVSCAGEVQDVVVLSCRVHCLGDDAVTVARPATAVQNHG